MTRYVVWARRSHESEPIVRCQLEHYQHAENEAIHIARASGEDGAMSVFVEGENGDVLWSAGEMARQLIDEGVRLDSGGRTLGGVL